MRGDPEDTHSRNKPARKAHKPSKAMQILWIFSSTLNMSSGRRSGECAKMNHIRAVCRSQRQAVHKLEEFEDSQVDMVNTDIFHSNTKCSGITA